MFFKGSTLTHMSVHGTSYRVRSVGSGPLLMLIHGQPQTHAMWHKITPTLSETFTVVCPDLVPAKAPEDLASDLLMLARNFGPGPIRLVGQDVGGMLAARMALQAQHEVEALALLQCLPAPTHDGRTDMAFELSTYESCWFGQLHPKPEARLLQQPSEWQELHGNKTFSKDAIEDYRSHSPWREVDGKKLSFAPLSLAGDKRRITCPVLMLWGQDGNIGGWYDPATLWQELAVEPVESHKIPGSTFLAEESPDDVQSELLDFFHRH